MAIGTGASGGTPRPRSKRMEVIPRGNVLGSGLVSRCVVASSSRFPLICDGTPRQ